jgi:hypothetical protein
MRFITGVFAVLGLIQLTNGFNLKPKFLLKPSSVKNVIERPHRVLDAQRVRQSSINMVVKMEVPQNPPLSLYEVFAPPLLDRTMLTWMLAGQALLLSFGLALAAIFKVDILHMPAMGFDLPAAQMSLAYAAAMSGKEKVTRL